MPRPVLSAEDVAARAAFIGLAIPEECMEGTLRNLRLLMDHAETLRALDDPHADPAELLLP
jgi:hypothetical protein